MKSQLLYVHRAHESENGAVLLEWTIEESVR